MWFEEKPIEVSRENAITAYKLVGVSGSLTGSASYNSIWGYGSYQVGPNTAEYGFHAYKNLKAARCKRSRSETIFRVKLYGWVVRGKKGEASALRATRMEFDPKKKCTARPRRHHV